MDQKHFPKFYHENVKRIYRFIYFRCGGNKEVSEDLTQDVFVKALNAFGSYDPKISASSWIFTIARNHLINYMEKQRPGVALEDIEQTWWDRMNWDQKAERSYDVKEMMKAIERLPKAEAELVRYKYLDGYSYDEIAQMTGKTVGSLRVQSHRTIKNLKKILKRNDTPSV